MGPRAACISCITPCHARSISSSTCSTGAQLTAAQPGDPALLNDDDPAELYGSSHPSITVAPNGRLDVAWWDFRNEAGTFGNDVYMTSSSDNGSTWTKNLRVTDRAIDRRIGPWYGSADIRQAPGLVSRDEFTLVIWDDTRNGAEVTQTQDVYASTVQYKALGGGTSSAARYALAGVIGFGAVGLGLAVVALAIRRREPPTRSRPGAGIGQLGTASPNAASPEV